MTRCQLCKREFGQLKFTTEHIKVCTRCVSSLNEFSEPAIQAQNRLGEMLARGMERNALRDLESSDDQLRQRARWTLDNFDAAYQRALRGWLNRLLANEGNTTRDFKTVRAQRCGLLRLDGDRTWSYPKNWKEGAARIRRRDGYACKSCGKRDTELHVHHIIYLSNFGTNQQSNLVTLCRACHEKEHDHAFDYGEQDDPESPTPPKPKPELAVAPVQAKPVPAETFSLVPARRTPPVASPPEEQDQAESRVCPGCGGGAVAVSWFLQAVCTDVLTAGSFRPFKSTTITSQNVPQKMVPVKARLSWSEGSPMRHSYRRLLT
jgi:hypothetical protein